MDRRIARIILQGALSLLQSSHTWTRGTLARNGRGAKCAPSSESAQRWCAQGALERSARELGFDADEASYFVREIACYCTGRRNGLAAINDNDGYVSVISKMQEGLARLGGAETEPMPASVVGALARLAASAQRAAEPTSPPPARCLKVFRTGFKIPMDEAPGHSAGGAMLELIVAQRRKARKLETI